jgi:hypothetical protein
VRTEADDPDERDAEQPQCARDRQRHPPPALRRREDEERQEQPGGQLDADPGRQRDGGAPGFRGRPGAQQQGQRQEHDQGGVVVGAADGQHEQHRVQSQEGGREARRASETLGGARGQPDRGEAAEDREGLQRPQRAGQAQRRGRIAGQREQGAVRRVLERPADQPEDRVGRGFGREVGVGVQSVQRAHPGEGHVAEDVLGDQRRPQQQRHVGEQDGRAEDPQRQRPGAGEDQQVAGADQHHEPLEAADRQLRAEARQRARQPAGPTDQFSLDVAVRGLGGVEDEHDQRAQKEHQAGRAEHLQRGPAPPSQGLLPAPGGAPRTGRRRGGEARSRRWPGHLHRTILTVRAPLASIRPCRLS